MTIIKAETILSSQHAQRPDKRLTTMVLTYPRPIHSEFMTHRQLSRNASSSRAIPVKKMIQDVMDNPFVPLHWGKNQKGMQAEEECNNSVKDWTLPPGSLDRVNAWTQAIIQAVAAAQVFADAGYHKQIVNRLLEPFMHIRVVVSATEWTNFLGLRDHPDAEPHIAMLAREVRKELNKPVMQVLQPGDWHTPFVDQSSDDEIHNLLMMDIEEMPDWAQKTALNFIDLKIKKAVSCCASTSYKTVDGFDMTLEKAVELHDKLVGSTPLHASPAEHVAQADLWRDGKIHGVFHEGWDNQHEWGNFQGFRQYRKQLPNECL